MSAIGGYSNYVRLLVDSRSEGSYICRNKKTDERAVFPIKKGFYIQPLRQVIQDGLRIKNELLKHPDEARTVVDILRAKCNKAKARLESQKQNAFVSLIQRICDCVCNFFQGFGLKTTLGLGNALIIELEKKASRQKSAPPSTKRGGTPPSPSEPPLAPPPVTGGTPPPPSDPPPSPLPLETGAKTPAAIPLATTNSPPATTKTRIPSSSKRRRHSFGSRSEAYKMDPDHRPKKGARTPPPSSKRVRHSHGLRIEAYKIEAYKKNPQHYPHKDKEELFNGIETIMPESSGAYNMVDFIKEITKKDPIDLHDPLAIQVVLDTISHGFTANKETSLVYFLAKEDTFHADLLIKCLDRFILKHQERNWIFNPDPVIRLLYVYIKKNWNASHPVNHPTIASAMAVLLMSNIIKIGKDSDKIDLLSWMMSDPAFDFQTFMRYISVFQLRKDANKTVEVTSQALDKLVEFYKTKPNWETLFDATKADLHKDLAFTLRYYASRTSQCDMTAEKLVKEIETFVKKKAALAAGTPPTTGITSSTATPPTITTVATHPAITTPSPATGARIPMSSKKRRRSHSHAGSETIKKDSVHSPETRARTPSPSLKGARSIHTRIEAYKEDPENFAYKKELFKEIETKTRESNGAYDMVDFIAEITKKDLIDLHDPLAMQVVLDIISYGSQCASEDKGNSLEDFLDSLAKQNSFHADLLIKCLDLFILKHRVMHGKFNHTLVRKLLNVYINKKWNDSHPVNHPTITSAMAVWLMRDFSNLGKRSYKKDMLSWMMSDSAFDFKTFICYISVYHFLNNKTGIFYNCNMPNSPVMKLIDYYKTKQHWETLFDPANPDLHDALSFILNYTGSFSLSEKSEDMKAEKLVKDIETFVKKLASPTTSTEKTSPTTTRTTTTATSAATQPATTTTPPPATGARIPRASTRQRRRHSHAGNKTNKKDSVNKF